MKIRIANGRVIDPARIRRHARHVPRRRQDRCRRPRAEAFSSDRTIDAAGLVVAPGLIDPRRPAARALLRKRATHESRWNAAMPAASRASRFHRHRPRARRSGLVEMLATAKKQNRSHVYPSAR